MEKLMRGAWATLTPEEKKERQRVNANNAAKNQRDWLKQKSPEELEEYKRQKEYQKERRLRDKEDRAYKKAQTALNKREMTILKYMLKTGVSYYHHKTSDDLVDSVKKAIEHIKTEGVHTRRDSYYWNRNAEQSGRMPLSFLGKLWSHNQFETIYDVPLDGSWIFYGYDSGERGLGSFHRISVHPVGDCPFVPKVNPGGFPQIIAN